MNDQSKLYKKVLGCIMGGAVGDAFGGPLEGMHADFIRKLYDGPVTELSDYSRRPDDFFLPEVGYGYAWTSNAGSHTDDTYMAGLLARCIIEKGGRINCDDLGEFWIKHLDANRVWFSLQKSYWNLMVTDKPAREVSKGNICDNSSPMCIGPVGVINAGDPAQAALDAYDVTTLMHDDCARDAAGMLAAAIAEAMRPNATVDSVVNAAATYLPGGKQSLLYKPLMLALELARTAEDYNTLTKAYYDCLLVECVRHGDPVITDGRHYDSVNPLESVPCAIGMFLNAKGDYRQTIIGAANFGRDCDTVACMAGYIAGAFCGVDGIPSDWAAACDKENQDADFTELAQGLTKTLLARIERDMARCDEIRQML